MSWWPVDGHFYNVLNHMCLLLGDAAFPGRDSLPGHQPDEPGPAADQGVHRQPATPGGGLPLSGGQEGRVSRP